MIKECHITIFLYFCFQIRATLHKTYERKKKRCASLILENVRNSQIGYKDSIVALILSVDCD